MKKVLIFVCLAITSTLVYGREGFYIGGEAGTGILLRAPKKKEIKSIYYLRPVAPMAPNGVLGANNAKRDSVRFLGGLYGGYNFSIDDQLNLAPQIGFRYVQKAQFKASNLADIPPVIAPGGFNGELFNASHQLNIIDLLALGTYRINSLWDIQGKIGIAYIIDKIKVDFKNHIGLNIPAYSKSKTKKTFRPEIGLGIGYNIQENVRLSLDVLHLLGSKLKVINIANSQSAAEVVIKQEACFNQFRKVPSLTAIMLSVQYLF